MNHSILTTVQIILASGLFFSCLVLMLLCLLKSKRPESVEPAAEESEVTYKRVEFVDPTLN